jgi:cation:H+ antiporter
VSDLLVLAGGLLGLWLGTEIALRSTIRLAAQYGLSQSFLGLAVLAVGTDLPELVVAIEGGLQQLGGREASGIVVGNAIGSALCQGSLVLGVAALFGHLRLPRRLVVRDGVALLLSVVLVGLLGADRVLDVREGVALLAVYVIYYVALFQAEKAGPKIIRSGGRYLGWFFGIAAGLIVVLFSAHLVVENALALAERWAVSQTVLGILLIGAGTSLPELVLSLGAAAKGRTGLSVGNVIGSNIFDVLVPTGASATLHPLGVEAHTLYFDLPVLAGLSGLGLVFFTLERGLQRREGLTLISLYGGYALVRLLLQ